MAEFYLACLARPCVERDDAWLWRDDRQLWTKSGDRFGPIAVKAQTDFKVVKRSLNV